MLRTNLSPPSAAARASLFAGPVFIVSAKLAEVYAALPAPMPVDAAAILPGLVFLVAATLFGFLLAMLPNFLGVAAMSAWARHSDIGRQPETWIGVGAAAGAGIALWFGVWDSSETAFALIMTSAVCAGLCRLFVALD